MKLILTILLSVFGLSSFAADSHSEAEKPYRNFLPQPKANKLLATLPFKVKLVSPKAFSKVGSSVTLNWEPSEGAETYHVQVAKDAAFKWIIAEDHFVTNTQFEASNLPAGQVFWRVAAGRPKNMAAHWKTIFTSSSFEVAE